MHKQVATETISKWGGRVIPRKRKKLEEKGGEKQAKEIGHVKIGLLPNEIKKGSSRHGSVEDDERIDCSTPCLSPRVKLLRDDW